MLDPSNSLSPTTSFYSMFKYDHMLYNSVLQSTTMYYAILHCTTLYYTVLHCTTLYYAVLHCPTYKVLIQCITIYYYVLFMNVGPFLTPNQCLPHPIR